MNETSKPCIRTARNCGRADSWSPPIPSSARTVSSLLPSLSATVPAIHQSRDFTTAGGLMSYGGQFYGVAPSSRHPDRTHLKGDKPADLPVQQVTKVELFINLKTAKALGIRNSAIAAKPCGRGDRIKRR